MSSKPAQKNILATETEQKQSQKNNEIQFVDFFEAYQQAKLNATKEQVYYKVISEFDYYIVCNETKYNNLYERLCNDKFFDMTLICTVNFKKALDYKDFDTICEMAILKQMKTGLKWHVVKFDGEYIEVEDTLVKKRNLESLFSI